MEEGKEKRAYAESRKPLVFLGGARASSERLSTQGYLLNTVHSSLSQQKGIIFILKKGIELPSILGSTPLMHARR
jgi:hypothetical protein